MEERKALTQLTTLLFVDHDADHNVPHEGHHVGEHEAELRRHQREVEELRQHPHLPGSG